MILLLSGDVDFNIQPTEARLSRVMHIELWAGPDYFSLRLHCIEHLSSPTLRAVKIIESLFEKALGLGVQAMKMERSGVC